jgi:cytosine/adenosine deaminase-related metal-dependent hydrolase
LLLARPCSPTPRSLATLDRVAEAGIAVVSLPMCNMYLQDRAARERTPRWRGVTLLHEMKARGVPVAVASDNTRDPFYAYGDLDMLEVFREATRILHLDHPVADWPRPSAPTPAADIAALADRGVIAAGGRPTSSSSAPATGPSCCRARKATARAPRRQGDRPRPCPTIANSTT